jgi:hypothetical protein
MNYDFYLKQGDTWPSLKAKLLDSDGELINVSLADSIRFVMTEFRNRNEVIVDSLNVRLEGDWVVYDWQSGETDANGSYQAEFVVNLGDGHIVTVPNKNDEYIYILIGKELG